MKIIRILIILAVVLLHIVPCYAGSSDHVVITMVPAITGGLSFFTITYVADTNMKFDLGYEPTADHIMIRGKYGGYPIDIPSGNVTPSDGYLVYYGNGVTTNDTSMDFDQNPGPLYYKVWAQKLDGSWFVNTATGNEESRQMTLLAIIAIAGLLTFAAIWSKNMLVAIAASGGWIATWVVFTNHPPYGASPGDTTQEVLLIVAVAAALAVPWYVVFRERSSRELDEITDRSEGFSVRRFLNHGDLGNRNAPKPHRETLEEYQAKVYRSLHPNGAYRRRR